MMTRLRQAIDAATRALTDAGVSCPRVDAEELAAHVAGTSRGRLALVDIVTDEFFGRYTELVSVRAQRVPLQHIMGTAVFGPLTLQVGPGVFIPRPETEALLEWATAQPLPTDPFIVDLCTGSGALAAALARHASSALVIGVDISTDALAWAHLNTAGTNVQLCQGDVCDPELFHDLDGRVDLIVANPPYIPDGVELEPEVAQHDPPEALYGGPDGTSVIAAIAASAGRWLTDGGLFAVEHDDDASAAVAGLLERTGLFGEVIAHKDFGGRPRFVTARRKITR